MKQTFAGQFLTACGAERPLRVSVTKGGEAGAENWVFPRPFFVIGRRADSDLVLDHWQVSRRHAYVQFLDGGFFCVDLASRTGTHGGEPTDRSGWIPHAQAIKIGPFEVRPISPSDAPYPSWGPADGLPGVTWELPQMAVGGATWRMDGRLALVGRSPSCRIRLVEKDVSKFHCSLVRTRLGVWAVDLLGQNGVFVNDEPIRCARLDAGDELRIGQHVLRPRFDAPPPRLDDDPDAAASVDVPGAIEVVPDNLPARLDASHGPAIPARLTFSLPAMPPAGPDLAAILGAQGRSLDPVMSAMVEQFGQMQHQMFEQFHNTMMAMFDGFAAMHREQSESMREEIDQVRRLSREIELLQAETSRLHDQSKEVGREASPPPGVRPGADLPSPPPPADPPVGPEGYPPTPPEAGPAVKPRRTPPGDGGVDDDIHAQLVRRLASIHSERQGRWQKILGMMSSRS